MKNRNENFLPLRQIECSKSIMMDVSDHHHHLHINQHNPDQHQQYSGFIFEDLDAAFLSVPNNNDEDDDDDGCCGTGGGEDKVTLIKDDDDGQTYSIMNGGDLPSSSSSATISVKKDYKWSPNETIYMITSWEKYSKNASGKTSTYNKWIYMNIQQDLQSSGYDRNLEQIRRKISQLKSRYFKEIRQSPNNVENSTTNWEYFKQLDRILHHQYHGDNKNINDQQSSSSSSYLMNNSENYPIESPKPPTESNKRIRTINYDDNNHNDDESNDDSSSVSVGQNSITAGDSTTTTTTANSFEDRIMKMMKTQYRNQQQQWKRISQQIEQNRQSIDLLQQTINRLQEQLQNQQNGQWYNNGMSMQKNWNYDYNNQYF
ncbi:uncharacterized protein LOC124489875 [Dermatophagoides farinae]|nr:putative uncharacterized protein DDB_G0267716 [Dermatophagoides farinae]XP_046908228.1 putative uncharacterized protein DDB_G0267716 [Dermatophagoides farinae]